MKRSGFFISECRRLLHSRMVQLVMALAVLSPLLGGWWYRPLAATMSDQWIASPALAGGLAGSLLFAFLTLYEWHQVQRAHMEALVHAVRSPLTTAVVRLGAMLVVAAFTLVLAMVVWLPVAMTIVGSVFDGWTYCLSGLLLMGAGWPVAILLASAAYQWVWRFDLSLVLMVALVALSLTMAGEHWFWGWLNPCVAALSDDFSNFRVFRSVAYMRLFWLCGALAAWSLSYLCIRRYGKSFIGAIRVNGRRFYRPVVAVVLVLASLGLYSAQPFVDQSNPDLSAMTFYEQPPLPEVQCVSRSAAVTPDVERGSVRGTASYQIKNASGQKQTAKFGLNPGYKIVSATANGKDVATKVGDYQESNMALLEVALPKTEDITLEICYEGFPREWNALSLSQGDLEISREYLCLENWNMAPYVLNMTSADDRMPASIDLRVPDEMTVIPFSLAEAKRSAHHDDGTTTWHYEDNGAGGIVYAGDYIKETIATDGAEIEFYYGRKHQQIMEEVRAAENIRAVADYCSAHYGAPSFAAGGSLKLIERRVSGGGYAAPGASLLDEADFTAANLQDMQKGSAPGEVLIHELVHQWWGLGRMFEQTDAENLWSAEGLTTYSTYRIVKALYGQDYAETHYVRQWQQTLADDRMDFYVRHPEYKKALPEKQQLAISNRRTQVRQYNEMPLKILKAEKLVGGEEKMDEILHRLFNEMPNPMQPYLTYEAFLDACGLTEEDVNLEENISL